MNPKGRKAWLITWEGTDFDEELHNKIVLVASPQLGEKSIEFLLPFLFSANRIQTLWERICLGQKIPSMSRRQYARNIEISFGYLGKEYLCARKVKDLRCEENKKDWMECTVYWTELAKYIFKTDSEIARGNNVEDYLKQVVPERQEQYTYSIRKQFDVESELKSHKNDRK